MSDSDSSSSGGDSDSDYESVSQREATTTSVLDWYSKLYSRRVDIVGDYAGNELFLIEGDSVLLHCFSDKHLDFDDGYQLLHASYLVESFLRGLVLRRCNFHIAFFDQHRELCVPQSASSINRGKYLLARAAIIRHLRVNLKSVQPNIEIHVFSDIRSEAFGKYLDATDLYFIMCHDGASLGSLRKRELLHKNLDALKDEDHALQEKELRTKTMFRLFIYWFLRKGYNAALVNGLEYLDTKVMTVVLESGLHTKRNVSFETSYDVDTASSTPSSSGVNISDVVAQIRSSAKTDLTERECLAVAIISKIGFHDGGLDESASAFMRHMALLSQFQISERSVRAPVLSDKAQKFLLDFVDQASRLLQDESWAAEIKSYSEQCDIADLVDGNLLRACVRDPQCGTGPCYQELLDVVARIRGAKLPTAPSKTASSATQSVAPSVQTSVETYNVLPFSNTVFDEHLAPVQLSVDRAAEIMNPTSSQIFREVSHWHNSKRPIDPKLREDQVAKSLKQQLKALRRNQFFMSEMTAYAGSLTNAVGKILDPEKIVSSGQNIGPVTSTSTDKVTENAKPKGNAKNNKKALGARKQAMLDDIAASKAHKDEASSDKILQGWRTTCAALEKEPTLLAKYNKAKQLLVNLHPDLKREVLEAEVKLYTLNVLLGMWIAKCRQNAKGEGLSVASLMMDTINSISKSRGVVTKSIADCLTATIKSLGLPQMPVSFSGADRKLAFTLVLNNPLTVDIAIPLSAMDFQLAHCGPYFERSIDSAPDPRVPFEPDAWQRKVLDEIDAKRSLLVIAPTSAGKTFISFYAMKKVLVSGEDDILVYVAPTKALVNQIAAEVQARFSKTYKRAGKSVWGIHTRDYRINNPTGCQILVTVPHILQIMLLAPSNANSWSKRVKWIIFDEVHCIGQAEDGLIWEQLLLLAPCPIIALSATIGNPEEFKDWLISTQKAVGNDLTMVQHPHRYSDLRKFVYTPPKSFSFEGLPDNRAFAQLGLDDCNNFTFIHPVASLVNRSRGMPDDLSFEARDCFTLWQSMSKRQTAKYPLDKSLDPSAALPSVIKKIDIIKWEAGLKKVLRSWMADSNSPFSAVFHDLNLPLDTLETDRSKDSSGNGTQEAQDNGSKVQSHRTADSTLALLVRLHEQDALPGIIFNYDRGICEKICQNLIEELESAESAWKKSSPKWQTKLTTWETWKKAMAKAGKRGPPKVSKKKGGGGDDESLSKADLMRDAASDEVSPWASFDPENPVDGFHFADNKKLTQEELNANLKELIRRQVPQWLLDALRRGIGVHHAGMNRKYRQVVEMLFRKGYLRVVIATGTLALGINMPCKTVVFSGDSVFLTALNYRQAAGRAGRRGFDMLGNVVFHGISTNKVRRLISSRLPDLNGHFPITTTLVLRLFTLLNESKDAPFAVRSVNALLSQPRLYLGGEESKMTVLHHLRFSIEYLRRQYLLDSRGAPLNLAGCVSHLYFAENSAFAFHALLKDGYFHNLCSDIDKKGESVVKDLMLTMAHLFGRQYCRQADQEFVEEVVKRSPSMVFLPPMPAKAADVLREHNRSTLNIFTAYVQTFVQQHIKDTDDTLPLTQLKVGGDSVPESARSLHRRTPTKVRSSFVALSGNDDRFDSIHDLCTTARSGVFLEEAVVPYVGLYPEESEMPLNAYLYDFYIHGDTTALSKANKIRAGEVWFVLNDFSMVLATIVTSISNFMNLGVESDLDFADVRGEGEEAEEAKEDKFLPDDSGYETASTASGFTKASNTTQDLSIQTKKKSKKVADSWDDDADEEELEENVVAKDEQKMREFENQEKPAWEEGTGMLNVLKAFKQLRQEFDTKFRAMWA